MDEKYVSFEKGLDWPIYDSRPIPASAAGGTYELAFFDTAGPTTGLANVKTANQFSGSQAFSLRKAIFRWTPIAGAVFTAPQLNVIQDLTNASYFQLTKNEVKYWEDSMQGIFAPLSANTTDDIAGLTGAYNFNVPIEFDPSELFEFLVRGLNPNQIIIANTISLYIQLMGLRSLEETAVVKG